MKKFLVMGLFLILMLSGCGANEALIQKDNNSNKKEFSGTLEIGDIIYSGADYKWKYDGIVADSIVISVGSNGGGIFIPKNSKNWISLPRSSSKKIKINSINEETGSIDIDFIIKGE